MGITNRLLDTENTSNGTVVQGGPFDGKTDPRASARTTRTTSTASRCSCAR